MTWLTTSQSQEHADRGQVLLHGRRRPWGASGCRRRRGAARPPSRRSPRPASTIDSANFLLPFPCASRAPPRCVRGSAPAGTHPAPRRCRTRGGRPPVVVSTCAPWLGKMLGPGLGPHRVVGELVPVERRQGERCFADGLREGSRTTAASRFSRSAPSSGRCFLADAVVETHDRASFRSRCVRSRRPSPCLWCDRRASSSWATRGPRSAERAPGCRRSTGTP